MRSSVTLLIPRPRLGDTTSAVAFEPDQCPRRATQNAPCSVAPASRYSQERASKAVRLPYASNIPIVLSHRRTPASNDSDVNLQKGKCDRWSDRIPTHRGSFRKGHRNQSACPYFQSQRKRASPRPGQTSLQPSRTAIRRFRWETSNPASTTMHRPLASSTRSPPFADGVLIRSTGNSSWPASAARLVRYRAR